MSSRQFAEWIALQNVDPQGEFRMDLRFARAFCRLASVMATGTHYERDYLLDFREKPREKPVDSDELKKLLMPLFGGTQCPDTKAT